VGRGTLHLHRSQGARGPADVLDHDRLAKLLGELLGDQARDQVRTAARGEWDHEADRTGGIGLRPGAGSKGEREDDGEKVSPEFHGGGSLCRCGYRKDTTQSYRLWLTAYGHGP